MGKLTTKLFSVSVLIFYITSYISNSDAESSKATNYQELKKDGRLYVFTSPERMASFISLVKRERALLR